MKNETLLNNITDQFNISEIFLGDFLINILITVVLSYVIGLVYTKYGNSLSNREKLSQTFVLLSVIVMLVITIVKSSLALSLGLVGALSIVRFRTAIKEPEELVYFFLAIAVGLGLGANQKIITLVGTFVIIMYIVIQNLKSTKQLIQQNLIITISNTNDEGFDENKIIKLLEKFCSKIELRRLDHNNKDTELALNVMFKDLDSILNAKNELKTIGDIQFSFIENY